MVSSECQSDCLFLAFYSELTYRHMFTYQRPTLAQKISCYKVFTNLFDEVLKASNDPQDFAILPEWAFEICHEFVYQFQGFCQYRTSIAADPDNHRDEIELLKANRQAWDVGEVTKYLNMLVDSSNLKSDPSGSSAKGQINHVLGYFAAVSLSRLNCLLGDYHGSVSSVSMINLSDRSSLNNLVFSSRLSLCYHVGISYFNLRRYKDCARVLSKVSHELHRALKHDSRRDRKAGSYEREKKINDKMIAVLAIMSRAMPQYKPDDNTVRNVQDKFNDKLQSPAGFADLYAFACPKFVCGSCPDYDSNTSGNNLTTSFYNLQVSRTVNEINNLLQLRDLRSYLRLYTSIPMPKLEKLAGEGLSRKVVNMKSSAMQLTRSRDSKSPLDGEYVSTNDTRYYVKGGVLRTEVKERESRTDKFFVNQVGNARETRRDVEGIAVE